MQGKSNLTLKYRFALTSLSASRSLNRSVNARFRRMLLISSCADCCSGPRETLHGGGTCTVCMWLAWPHPLPQLNHRGCLLSSLSNYELGRRFWHQQDYQRSLEAVEQSIVVKLFQYEVPEMPRKCIQLPDERHAYMSNMSKGAFPCLDSPGCTSCRTPTSRPSGNAA